MDLPRLIYLDEENQHRLISYLEVEILNHYGERSGWVNDLIDIQDDYFAEPATQERTFPFKGAANIIIPLIAIAVEALHAKTMTTLFALDDQFATVKVPDVYEDINHGLTKFVNYELLENGADFYKFCDQADLENIKFGTVVGKAGYEKIEKTAVQEIGGEENEFTVTVKQGAVADTVSLPYFVMPFYANDPQTAPWCGEEHLKTAYEVKAMCDSGFFYEDAWDNLKNWVLQTNAQELSSTPYKQEMQELQNQQPVWPKTIGFLELWMSWDTDDSGKDKEIVVYYHRLSRRILGIRYNWYRDLRRPYRIGNLFTVEHRWCGIGAGKQGAQFQREVTIQHRQRLDNATIANIRMFKINKLSGYGPGEPIFPGKMWFVDSMDDIESLEAGEVYPSSMNDEIQTLNYHQQRLGVNELNQGMPEAGTPGTATSNTIRLQEGNRKSDYTFKNFKRFTTQVARDCIYNVCQFGARNIEIFDYIPNGQFVRQFIQQAPLDLIKSQLIMNIKLIGQNENAMSDRVSWTQLAGQLQQYYTGLVEFAMQTKDMQLMQVLAKYIPSGATEAMQQILETYDIRNIERVIPIQLIMGYNPQGITNPAVQQQLMQMGNIPLIGGGEQNGPTGANQAGTTNRATGTQQVPGMGNSPTSSALITGNGV